MLPYIPGRGSRPAPPAAASRGPRGTPRVVVLAACAAGLRGAAAGQTAQPAQAAPPPIRFQEASAQSGLGEVSAARVAAVDLNGDGRPDLVADRARVFLNQPAQEPPGFRFQALESGLAPAAKDAVGVFVDLTGDGVPDAVFARSIKRADAALAREAWNADPTAVAWWQRGRGDGTFEPPLPLTGAEPATTAAIAAGDVDADGRTDLLLGNWYVAYGESMEAFPATLLRNGGGSPPSFQRVPLPEESGTFDEDRDAAGRPIYGALIARLLPDPALPPQLALLAYGRRWNRLYSRDGAGGAWQDVVPAVGFDGDGIRHGRYPEWLRERAKTDSRFPSADEKPFRANGNSFDLAVGDVDNDGRFDAFIAEITHAWAGPSSDRSRFLISVPAAEQAPRAAGADGAPGAAGGEGAARTSAATGGVRFVSPAEWCVDRIPQDPADPEGARSRWNQGDLFAELADLDLDGRLDLVLASGDYPDPPPHDERLRIFRQRPPGADPRMEDVTLAAGVDHPGCGQISTADFDLDGRLDVVAGQSFNRFTPEMIKAAGGTPRVHLWLNRTDPGAAAGEPGPRVAAAPAPSLELLLRGDPSRGVAAVPLGALVRITQRGPEPRLPPQLRQLMGPGGHSGKQTEWLIHAAAPAPVDVEITWPATPPITTRLESVPPGRWLVDPSGTRLPAPATAPRPELPPAMPPAPQRAAPARAPLRRRRRSGLERPGPLEPGAVVRAGAMVLLRAPKPADREEFVALRRSSPAHLRCWEPRHPGGAARGPEESFQAIIDGASDPWFRRMFLCRAADGAIVGAVNFNVLVPWPTQGTFVGYWLGRHHEGRGLMREGLSLALDHAFRDLRLHRVEAAIMPRNLRSRRLVRALGFRREGVARKLIMINGRWEDHERWAILAPEWLTGGS